MPALRAVADALPNARDPKVLDIAARWTVPAGAFDLVLCCNVVHIAPPPVLEGLLKGASAALRSDGSGELVLYGPFRMSGRYKSLSDARFDRSLRRRDASYGYRDIVDVARLARRSNLVLRDVFDMPANNYLLRFRREAGPSDDG